MEECIHDMRINKNALLFSSWSLLVAFSLHYLLLLSHTVRMYAWSQQNGVLYAGNGFHRHGKVHFSRKLMVYPKKDEYDFHPIEDTNPTSPVMNQAFQTVAQTFLERRIDPKWRVEDQFDKQQHIQRIHFELVSQGQKFALSQDQSQQDELWNSNFTLKYPTLQRVPGCIANVRVQTILVPSYDENDSTSSNEHGMYASVNPTTNYRVLLRGQSDALLSRGLLAVLATVMSSKHVLAQHVLQVDPTTVADQLGLRSILSSGRNDGLASITKVVQDQIRSLFKMGDGVEVDVSTMSTNSSISTNLSNDFLGRDMTARHSLDSNHDLGTFENQNASERRPTVAMLLSGGVDSSVALNLLLRQNYNVTAFYLKIWLEDELAHLGQCPWEDDFKTCQAVCEHAGGVPLETISLQNEYKERVIQYTIEQAKRGRTPNPDIMCNSRVKFGCFYDAIEGRGFDYVATGHYAQLVHDENMKGSIRLLRAPDPIKDQSYFLSALTQQQLRRVLFPIGHYYKTQVRELANGFNLPNKHRPDSQGLCFLGKVKFDNFLEAYLGNYPGDIVNSHNGEIIGKHNGLWFHTVGQRKGMGKVLHPKVTSQGPWYVVAKDPVKRIVYASNQYDEDIFTQARSEFYIEDILWIAGNFPAHMNVVTHSSGTSTREGHFLMKIRHGPTLMGGTLTLDITNKNNGFIRLDSKDKGLAPGQYVALYSEDDAECFGSGVISEKHWATFLIRDSTINSVTSDV